MNSEHDHAEKVWASTLTQIRQTRDRRRRVKIGLAAATACLFALSWIAWTPAPEAQPATASNEPIPQLEETIAVMRIDETGSARLEEFSPDRLGSIELAFGLTPLIPDEPQP